MGAKRGAMHGRDHRATGSDPIGGGGGERDLKINRDDETVVTGDGQLIWMVPSELNGLNLISANAYVTTVSSSSAPTIQIRNVTQTADMLSTAITIDATEFTSYTAATPSVVDTANDDVATGDLIAIDVDAAGTGAKGLGVVLVFDSDPAGTGATGAAGATGATGPAADYAKVSDQKTQNTTSGTFTSGAWQTRTLNTEDTDVAGFLVLASNQITLQAGTYICRVRCPAFSVARNQARLYNVTDTSVVLLGGSAYCLATTQTDAWVCGVFTIGASKALEVQHYCETTKATQGFGAEANFTTEVYAEAEFWKIG